MFDFVGQYSTVPELLAAAGPEDASDRQRCIIEHQLRALFAFFHGVDAAESACTRATPTSATTASPPDPLRGRLAKAVSRGLPVVRATLPEPEPQSALSIAVGFPDSLSSELDARSVEAQASP